MAVTNFGTFRSLRTNRRTARNPQTGGRVVVPPHQIMRFRPSDALVEAVRRRRTRFDIGKAPKGTKTPLPAPDGEAGKA